MAENARHDINITRKSQNPFVGIRPLDTSEKHLFFGRDTHVKSIVNKLYTNHFVVISGASGIGKTSLVNCGIIPEVLKEGHWKIISSEIIDSPLENLCIDFLRTNNKVPSVEYPEPCKDFKRSEFIKYLKEDSKKNSYNYLVVIDQFEQLVLNGADKSRDAYEKALASYINLLVDLINEKGIPVYIIISIRSDYIEKFVDYSEFTELVNDSHYLLPLMADVDLREAISGPLKFAGVDCENKLTDRIIDDLKGKQDKLALMQHVLMRSFNIWKESAKKGEPLSVELYEQAGTVDNALHNHAEEAYSELTENNKKICERIFKTITAKISEDQYVKLHIKIEELVKITQVEDYIIIKIINVFNKKSRPLLIPSQDTLLTEDSYVSLSHEVLIRNWGRLKSWVDEEADSVEMYKRLADSAFKFQMGKGELWSSPELDQALAWREKNAPNATWAHRHNPAFERTMVFLELSEIEHQQKTENVLRHKLLKKNWVVRISVFAALVVLVVLGFALLSDGSEELSESSDQAQTEDNFSDERNITLSPQADQERISENEDTDIEDPVAQNDLPVSQGESSDPISSGRDETSQDQNVERNQRATEDLSSNRDDDASESTTSPANETDSDIIVPSPDVNQNDEETTNPTINREKMQDVSFSMAEASIQIDNDPDLKVLLAYQSFLFNEEYNNNSFEPVIYEALYRSLKTQLGDSYNAFTGPSKAVRSIDFLPNSTSFFTAGSEGNILKWNARSENPQYNTILSGRGILEKIKVTNDGKWLIIAENRNGILLHNLSSSGSVPEKISGNDLNIRSIALAPDNNTFYTAGTENFIERFVIDSRMSEVIIETGSRINSLALSPNGRTLAAGSRDGKLITWNTSGNFDQTVILNVPNNAVQSVNFSPNGRYLACGLLNGKILIFSTGNFELVKEITEHQARVTEIDFSPDGRFLASSAYDGKVLLWNMNDFSSSPVIFNDNGGFVFTVNFSTSGNYMVSGSAQENRLVVRSVSSSSLADRSCFLVSRNMTRNEWDNYVGQDIPYRETCSD